MALHGCFIHSWCRFHSLMIWYRWTWIWRTTVWRIFAYDGRYAWSQSDAYQVFVICIRQILHKTDQFPWAHWVRHIQVHLYCHTSLFNCNLYKYKLHLYWVILELDDLSRKFHLYEILLAINMPNYKQINPFSFDTKNSILRKGPKTFLLLCKTHVSFWNRWSLTLLSDGLDFCNWSDNEEKDVGFNIFKIKTIFKN